MQNLFKIYVWILYFYIWILYFYIWILYFYYIFNKVARFYIQISVFQLVSKTLFRRSNYITVRWLIQRPNIEPKIRSDLTALITLVIILKISCIFFIIDSKIVRCAVTLDTSFAQCRNREYRMVNKIMLLNSACIVPLCKNVNKQLMVK